MPAQTPNDLNQKRSEDTSDVLNRLSLEIDSIRSGCGALETLSRKLEFDETLTIQAIRCLRDLVIPLFDIEAETLFPQLESRAHRDDDFRAVIVQLSTDHGLVHTNIRSALCLLERLRNNAEFPQGELAMAGPLTDLTSRIRQHVALLGAVILPIARLRLTNEDLAALNIRLASS
jgi:hypothetical protein